MSAARTWLCVVCTVLLVLRCSVVRAAEATQGTLASINTRHGDTDVIVSPSGATADTSTISEDWARGDDAWASPPGRCFLPKLRAADVTVEEFKSRWSKQPFIYTFHPRNETAARAAFSKHHLIQAYGNSTALVCNSEGAGPMRGCEAVRFGTWLHNLSSHVPSVDTPADEIQYVSQRRSADAAVG